MELTNEQLYRLHTSGGGNMTWREVGQYAGISWQSARGKGRRWQEKQQRQIIRKGSIHQVIYDGIDVTNHLYKTPPGLPPSPTEIESRVKHIEDMLEKLIGKQEQEDAGSEDNPF